METQRAKQLIFKKGERRVIYKQIYKGPFDTEDQSLIITDVGIQTLMRNVSPVRPAQVSNGVTARSAGEAVGDAARGNAVRCNPAARSGGIWQNPAKATRAHTCAPAVPCLGMHLAGA